MIPRDNAAVVTRGASTTFLLLAVALGACHSAQSPSPAGSTNADASTIALSSCEGQTATSRDATASLSIRVTPAPSPTSRVAIYVESETNKSLTRDSTERLHRFELPRGIYAVRVTMDGFNSTAARVTLTAGCNAELTATMRKRAGKRR